MFAEWRSLYEAALRELDPAKLPELCQQARLAIFHRKTLIGAPLSPLPTPARTRKSESEELKEAMIRPKIHERENKR